jgi:hypothetical protein
MGFSQPRLFALKYAHELTESGNLEDEYMAIMDLLPTKSDYAAKPTHMSTSNGVWLVKHNTKEGTTHFSDTGREITGDETFDSSFIAHGLSEYLHEKPNDESDDHPESWALRNVNTGIVVEERFTAVQNENIPPLEFNIFTIWGKVWAAQMNVVDKDDRFENGFFLRNGTMLFDRRYTRTHKIPDWLDFSELVRIAEQLGANKDMFRTDIFVGVPSGTPALREGATSEEIRASVTIAVSESEIYPTTAFWNKDISEEGARLWVAGYKIGNYGIVPNMEVPPEYLETASFHSTKVWEKTHHTLSHFEVGGVNLARYKQKQEAEQTKVSPKAEPFELYADFDIADQITGDESWDDLIAYRRLLERPSLSFYVDKVARKRWLPTMGFSQPRLFALKYAHELTESGNLEDERMAIMDLLPTTSDYAAKPTHMSAAHGVWLVRHNTKDGIPRVSDSADKMTRDAEFDGSPLANGLVESLHEKPEDESDEDPESWALRNVNPGIIIEELFTHVQNENVPPLEFNIFTIWGKVWIAQMNVVVEEGRFNDGFVFHNGTMLPGQHGTVPDWLDFSELVRIAEQLGANKDMFRTDIFVGVPAGVLGAGASKEEGMASIQYAVSESEIYPTTVFWDTTICEEGARLWIAGYKIGNYSTVPNTEVPPAFLETGSCALSACDA